MRCRTCRVSRPRNVTQQSTHPKKTPNTRHRQAPRPDLEEHRGFWAWSTVEVLRFTGIRAIYTHVSGDFMNTALRKALAPALGGQAAGNGSSR